MNMAPPSASPDDEETVAVRPREGASSKKNDGKLQTFPSFSGKPGDSIYDAISVAVSLTNDALRSCEETTGSVSTSVMSRVTSLGKQVRHVFRDAFILYERRGQYGPQLVTGSAFLFGGLAGLRRGRVPGVTVGLLAGAASYGNIYGIEAFGLEKKK